eukprot:TRINITY_DN3026_c0_g1_i1.p1 TRINITY_DN3026_c0_g1~~TRINITY_DN3026_c0_g1_i1.p1  ORF type:complete len:384 (+),score=79.46 TRINITY_DN3026_c0_g1_i1:79-1230(+)
MMRFLNRRLFSSASTLTGTSRKHVVCLSPGSASTSLRVQPFEVKAPPKEHLQIKVLAAGVNPIDVRMREGYGRKLFSLKAKNTRMGDIYPLVLGREASGIVTEVGKGCNYFKVGDEVVCATLAPSCGCYTEVLTVPEKWCTLKPSNVSHEEAASIAYAGLTVYTAFQSGYLDPVRDRQKHVVIVGGSGPVGAIGIQLLKSWGFTRISAVCGHDNIDYCKSLGATNVVSYDKNQKPFHIALQDQDVSFVLDAAPNSLSREALAKKLLAGRSRSKWLFGNLDKTYVTLTSQAMTLTDANESFMKGMWEVVKCFTKKWLQFGRQGIRYRWAFFQPSGDVLHSLFELVHEGKIKVKVDKTFPLSQTVEAHQYFEKGHNGKIVLVNKP